MSTTTNRFARKLVEFSDQSEDAQNDELVIPENLSDLSAEELTELGARANEAFDAIYGDGTGEFSDDDLSTLSELAEGIEALNAEITAREAASAERAEKAAELASRLRARDAEQVAEDVEDSEEDEEDENEGEEPEGEVEEVEEEGGNEESAAQTITASAPTRSATRIPLRSVNRRVPATPKVEETAEKTVLFAAGEGTGFTAGQGISMRNVAEALDRKLSSYNAAQYRSASMRGQHIKEQHSLAVVKRNFPEELRITSNDSAHVDEVLSYATSENRLQGGSLVAAGGWCAPSEQTYEMLELESRDGLLSVPEVNVVRGGLQWPVSPTFQDIFSNIEGFSFTEEQAIAGEYDNGEVGDKPCYHIDCPDWDEVRLDVDGLCITAGLLQRRGFPEYQERIIRGALIAHDHRMNAKMIAKMADGSTAVTMPSQQAGTTAPVLTAIELQVEHYRYTHRLGRSVTLEAVFPFWVRGAIRADLARRGAKDLLAVTDAEIQAWFTLRGVAPQFVYNWQGIDSTAAGSFTAFPGTVDFLLYTAGTWIRGADDVITLDTLYDSTLLAQNDYTALFTEEGWFVAKRGVDSRKVTLSIEANGATHAGVAIEHDGTTGPIIVQDTGANNPELVLPGSGE